ncbi:MAG: hypothetical protein J5802_07105 [Butyrivibrio sp.]|nr:hypothetical protein [Butyrivibrio sp.]
MKKRIVSLLFPLAMILCVACSGSDVNELVIESSPAEESDENADTANTASSDAATDASTAATEVEEDKEFYCEHLEDNKKKEVDLGNDGQMDTILLECTDDHHYSLKVNDKSIDLITDNTFFSGFEFWENYADVFFVHRSDGDYLISDIDSGTMPTAGVTLFECKDGSFTEAGSAKGENLRVTYDDNGEISSYEIFADKIGLAASVDYFGSSFFCRDYSYGSNGLVETEELYKIHYRFIGQNDKAEGLTLKKSLTFYDESGKELKTLEAGQTVYHYEGNKPFKDNDKDVQKTGNKMSFVSEDGEFLGYITYELRDNGSYYEPYVDGVKEDEIFDNIQYADI